MFALRFSSISKIGYQQNIHNSANLIHNNGRMPINSEINSTLNSTYTKVSIDNI